MLHLPNGCYCSELTVNPAGWMTGGAMLIKKDWYIQYKFYDPNRLVISEYTTGRLMILKKMNRIKTLKERREATRAMIENELDLLQNHGYNPISIKQRKGLPADVPEPAEPENLLIVQRTTPFLKALDFALQRSMGVEAYKLDIESALRYIGIAARALKYTELNIYDIRVDHISNLLEYCLQNNINWSPKRYNKVKGELGGLFRYLIEKNAASSNAPRDVKKMPVKENEREVLTAEEIRAVKKHLYKTNRPFYNFMMIFKYSGGREIELMRLKGRNVNLKNQTYTAEVLKGTASDISRTITNKALPFWKEHMKNCKPDEYLWSTGLKPGLVHVNSRQITRRWKRLVKDKLGITADFYSWKHINTGEIVEEFGIEAAAFQNGHKSTDMVKKHYGKKAHEKRLHEMLKGASGSNVVKMPLKSKAAVSC